MYDCRTFPYQSLLYYTGEVVRNHGVDRYRYRSVHHSDSLKNAITCEWSLFVRSFNVNETV